MTDFGGDAMPRVTVIGGTDHKIFFNKANSAANDSLGIQTGITNALSAALNVPSGINIMFAVKPNPAHGTLMVENASAISEVVIMGATGRVAKSEKYDGGILNPTVNISGLAAGIYVVKVTDINGITQVRKIVKE
jgi:hypothetical protein